jgi:excisionase family DNA binding protein
MELLTAQELCATLKISRTTLYRYTLAGMPHLGRGRLRRFFSDEVLNWLAQHPSLVLLPGRYRCGACGNTGRLERRVQGWGHLLYRLPELQPEAYQ